MRVDGKEWQADVMRYDPATGERRPYPSAAKQYRDYHGPVAWLINPWTGAKRDPRDIGTDVFGMLCCQDLPVSEEPKHG